MNKKIACCTICKYQQDHIREFVEHCLYNVGFDFIFIGDNEQIDSTIKYEQILKDFIDKKQVVVYNLRGMKAMQLKFYNIVYKAINYNEFSHIAFIDADEFITFGNEQYKNIHNIINNLSDVDCIGLNWVNYANLDRIEEDHALLKDVFSENNKLNNFDMMQIKTIYKTNLPIQISIHCGFFNGNLKCTNADGKENINAYSNNFITRSKFNKELYTNSCYIKHYQITSIEQAFVKRILGSMGPELRKRRLSEAFPILNDDIIEKIKIICKKYNIDYEGLKK